MPADIYAKTNRSRIHQGDIFQNLKHSIVKILAGELEVIKIEEPFAVVVSQDCDLQWDFEYHNNRNHTDHDKLIADIIVIPAYLAEEFKEGKHLYKLELQMNSNWSKEQWNTLIKNKNERYYFLEEKIDFGIPNLVLDFKRYYTVSREEIYNTPEEDYVVSINPLYREDLSQKFTNYLSRIGLPE